MSCWRPPEESQLQGVLLSPPTPDCLASYLSYTPGTLQHRKLPDDREYCKPPACHRAEGGLDVLTLSALHLPGGLP